MTHNRHVLAGFLPALCLVFGLPAIAAADTPREIAERTTPSVVLLVMEDQDGRPLTLATGFVVGDGLVATNYHVVKGAARGFARVVGTDERTAVRAVFDADQDVDLALLSVERLKAAALPLGDSAKVSIGDEVFVLSNPEGLEGTFSAGIVSAIRRSDDEHRLQITAPISSGSSGGPVLNTEGKVIGIVAATITEGQNLNFAIPAEYLVALLSRPRVTEPLDQQLSWLGQQVNPQLPADAEIATSVESIRKAAEEGDPDAMYQLGELYHAGRGVLQNYFEAARLFRQAADAEHTRAMHSLGSMYAVGNGVPKDPEQALAWLRKAAALGETAAYSTLALTFDHGWHGVSPDPERAAHWYRKAAENGAWPAARSLGIMYLEGRGVPQDESEAEKWLRMAAEKCRALVEAGDTSMLLTLADMYDLGHGVPQDDLEAAKLVRKAAEDGQIDRIYYKGFGYELGLLLCERNPEQAARWYHRAATYGHARAMSRLGSMYSTGSGVRQDQGEAVRLFRQAAELGDAEAMMKCGAAYASGTGVERDDREAVIWFRKAAEHAQEKAIVLPRGHVLPRSRSTSRRCGSVYLAIACRLVRLDRSSRAPR